MLEIAPTDDRRAIKRAYAAKLKDIDVDRDADGFIRLRDAMETAQAWGSRVEENEEDWDGDGDQDWPEDEEGDAQAGLAFHPLHFRFDPLGGFTFLGGQPALPLIDDPGLIARCERIDAMLFDDTAPDPADIAREGRALLSSDSLDGVDVALAVEMWLAEAIVAAMPRSDPLSVPAINHFGWRSPAANWKRPAVVDAVLERYDDRVWLVGPALDVHADALVELQRASRARLGWFELGLALKVKALLKVVRDEHPSVERDFDEASVAWWDAYLAGRRPPDHFWLQLGAGPPILTFVAVIGMGMAEWSVTGAQFALVFAASVIVTMAALAAQSELRARSVVRDELTERGRGLKELGWAPALLLLPMIAASAASEGFVLAVVFGIAAASAAVWAESRVRFVGDADAPHRQRRRGFSIIAALVGLLAIVAAPSPSMGLAVSFPLIMLCAMAARGFDTMVLHSADLSRREWRRAVLALLAAHLALGAALVGTLPGAPFALMVAAPSAVVAQHWLVAGHSRALAAVEWPVRIVASGVYFTSAFWTGGAFGIGAFAGIAAYGLMLSAASLLAALRQEGVA